MTYIIIRAYNMRYLFYPEQIKVGIKMLDEWRMKRKDTVMCAGKV